jgi:hypothetical protein
VLALVNGEPITIADLERSLSAQPALVREVIQGSHGLRQYLRQMIRAKLLRQEAARLGLLSDPDVLTATRQGLARLLLNQWRGDIALSAIDDDTLRARLAAHPDRYAEPARASFLQLTSVDADRARRLYVALHMVIAAAPPEAAPPEAAPPEAAPAPNAPPFAARAFGRFTRYSETRDTAPRRDRFALQDADATSPAPLIAAALATPTPRVSPLTPLPNGGAGFVMPLDHIPSHPATFAEAHPRLLQDALDDALSDLATARLRDLAAAAHIEVLDPSLEAALTLPLTPINP